MTGFNDDYFNHYCYFGEEQTPYSDSKIRYYGNRDLPLLLYGSYKVLFGKFPKTYFDLGCGTGEDVATYLGRNVVSYGCDISDYCFNHINKTAEPFIRREDSITFLSSLDMKSDVIMDSVLQYLDCNEFNKQLDLMAERVNDNCVVGVIYDATERNHPYRKQIHNEDWWSNEFGKRGFKSIEEKDIRFEDGDCILSKFIFYKSVE